MLEELSKKDKQWRDIAYKICFDKALADDLVNDMYIKLHTYKTFNTSLVYKTLKSLFIDYVRKHKRHIPLEIKHDVQEDNTRTQDRKMILKIMKEDLTPFEKELLLQRQELSIRKLDKETNLGFMVIYYNEKDAMKKLKQACYERKKRGLL